MKRKSPESRRDFLKGASVTVGALGLSFDVRTDAAAPASTPVSDDFSKASAALQPDATVKTACQFCNSNCGLNIEKKAGRVIRVHGFKDDPVQAGEICVKAEMMPQLVYNRFRLTHPLKRVAGAKGSPDSKFEKISWDEALGLIADKFLALRDAGEAHTIVNRTTGRMLRGTGSVINRFFSLLGSPNDTDVGPVCNDAGGNALAATFGMGIFTNGYGVDAITGKEDLGSSKFYLFLGTNQGETHPVTFSHLLRSREKTKAKLVVVDPRLTPTGEKADEWLAIRPHSDMALGLAMLHHIIEKGLYDREFVAKWVVGFDELKKHLLERKYTPEWAAGSTDIPAKKIVELAEGYAKAKPAAIFCNAGISHQMNAFQTYRVFAMLAAVTGNVGKPGGGCNFMHNTWPGGLNLPPMTGEIPKKAHPALPVGPDNLADAILTGKPYPVRAYVSSGNPLIGSANTNKVATALKKLEFYVYTGLVMEEAAFYADVILPVASGLEFEGVYMRRDDRAIRWQNQAVPRVGESKTDTEIWIDLAHAMAKRDGKRAASEWTANFPLEWKDYKNLWDIFARLTPGVGGMTRKRLAASATPLRFPCPDEKHPGTSTLYLDHPEWYRALESLNPANKGKRFPTASGKIELFTPALDAKLAVAGHSALPVFYTHPEVAGDQPSVVFTNELVANPVNPQAFTSKVNIGAKSGFNERAAFPLTGIIGRASVVHFAGVTQWTYLGKQLNGVRLIQIHPKTAAAAGISDGETVVVESPRGAISGTALLWKGIREDSVFVQNSFGPAQAAGDEFGVPRYAAANVLVDDANYDNLSGQQAYKCFACRVKPARQ
jgi:anaerobic selenocysteine-containing dehydrogenase